MLRHVASWGDRIPRPASNAAPKSLSTAAQVFPSYREARLLGADMTPVAACEASRLAEDGEKALRAPQIADRSLIYASSSGACRIVGLERQLFSRSVTAADNQPAH